MHSDVGMLAHQSIIAHRKVEAAQIRRGMYGTTIVVSLETNLETVELQE